MNLHCNVTPFLGDGCKMASLKTKMTPHQQFKIKDSFYWMPIDIRQQKQHSTDKQKQASVGGAYTYFCVRSIRIDRKSWKRPFTLIMPINAENFKWPVQLLMFFNPICNAAHLMQFFCSSCMVFKFNAAIWSTINVSFNAAANVSELGCHT